MEEHQGLTLLYYDVLTDGMVVLREALAGADRDRRRYLHPSIDQKSGTPMVESGEGF